MSLPAALIDGEPDDGDAWHRWVDLYVEATGQQPSSAPAEGGALRRMLSAHGVEKLMTTAKAYLATEGTKGYYRRRGWSLKVLEEDFPQVAAGPSSGKRKPDYSEEL